MATVKLGRTADDIRLCMSNLLRELKDPRISPLLSIVKVDLSRDMSHCKFYVSAMEGAEQTRTSVEGLRSAAGYIRREMASRLKLRHVPQVHFIADDSIAYSANINRILSQELHMDETEEDAPEA